LLHHTAPDDDVMILRVDYFASYLSQVRRAMQGGADIRGYFAWSLMDNFEWADGFSKRFGLFRVNFSDPTRHRSPKLSAFFYRDYIRRHSMTDMTSSANFDEAYKQQGKAQNYV
jgi:beta-glucosidase/6-phospho-beta-glucosidase/beta-galactosidase